MFPAFSNAPVVVAAVVVIWSHRENARRLIRGEERRFSFHKSGERDEGAEKSDGEAR